jgi:hypothetical protein
MSNYSTWTTSELEVAGEDLSEVLEAGVSKKDQLELTIKLAEIDAELARRRAGCRRDCGEGEMKTTNELRFALQAKLITGVVSLGETPAYGIRLYLDDGSRLEIRPDGRELRFEYETAED